MKLTDMLATDSAQGALYKGDMSPRENSLAILNGEQPDCWLDFMSTMDMLPDPWLMAEMTPPDGQEHPDAWGTIKVMLPGAPGAHPHITDENKVVKDIEEWESQLVIPSLDGYDWSACDEFYKNIDRGEKFVGFFCPTGMFERSHFLMGMEDAFCAYMEDDEDDHPMYDMLGVIADWKIKQIYEIAERYRPDAIFYQDDWGSKQNLFLPPELWRTTILPHQKRIAAAIKDCGMLYVHHADCICAPIVDDMVELGIDIWQGVIPENHIVDVQKHIAEKYRPGAMAIQGGLDTPRIDFAGAPKELIIEEVHRTIDTYCPQGYFFPGFTGGMAFNPEVDAFAREELVRYGFEYAQKNRK